MRKLTFTYFIIILICLMIPNSVRGSEPLVIKFATLAPEGSTWMNTMRDLEKVIREKSNGRLGFRIYPGGVAGDELDVLKKIRIGQIHCAGFSGVGLGQILPMVRVLDLPFLFRDYREVEIVDADLEGFFGDRFREKGFEFLSWAEVGDVHLFSRSPIRKIDDMATLKVWAWTGDPIAKETFSAMGTNPILLAIADVTTALNTGMIDTVYAPPLGALALQWNLYTKFMTALPLAHSTGAVLMAKNVWERIPSDLQEMVKEEFRHAMARLTAELRKQTAESIGLIEKSGLTIVPMPDNADLNAFYKVHDHVAKALTGTLYPKDILDRVYSILKRPN